MYRWEIFYNFDKFALAYLLNSYVAEQISDINTQKQLIQTNKAKQEIDSSAIDVVEQHESESIVAGKTFDVDKILLKITNADKVKPPFLV